MAKLKYSLLIPVFFIGINCLSQNYLWLTDGKKIKVENYKIESPELISYQNLKGKTKTIDAYDVFSIHESNGNEKIIYVPDTSYVGAFKVEEMKSFVQGQFDASQKYKSPLTTIGGIAVAGVSSAFIQPLYVFLISGGYCTGIGLTNTRGKKLQIPAEFAQNEHYRLGYNKAVKHKRIKNAIIGSGIGLLAGLGTFAIINGK